MKLITWNCNMAFRKKAHLLLAYQPDILVIPECEHPSRLLFSDDTLLPTDAIWVGDNQHKGLGIFSFGKYKLKKIRNHNPELKTIVPVAVSGGTVPFTLFAIWANNPADPDGQYVTQVWKAIHHYEKKIKRRQTILTGDFNSNTIWDRKSRLGNHSDVVNKLGKKKILSCYHHHHGQEQGREAHPTFYLYRHLDKPYHLDYCFASRDLADKIISVEIGEWDYWKQYSDHVPVMIEFADE
jgi:exonuclease III